MEFNEVVSRRRTSREWTDRDVDFEVIKRIIGASMKTPSWDHYRSWQFIVLHTKEEKELGYSLRIPLNKEHNIVLDKLGVPGGWMIPCFIGIGYPKEDEPVLEQYDSKPDNNIHMGAW